MKWLALSLVLLLTGCDYPLNQGPKKTYEYSARGDKLTIECIGKAEYYTGIVLNTMIVTPRIGADGRGVYCNGL